jgi:ATP-dependent protease HslVU (ClpYQ) ATPase subunit
MLKRKIRQRRKKSKTKIKDSKLILATEENSRLLWNSNKYV